MRVISAIIAKELRIQFASPVAYVVLVGFLMLSGFFFYDLFSNYSKVLSYATAYQNPQLMEQINLNDLVVTPLMQNINVLLLLVIPLITMRMLAEEKRQGTDELILTSPVGIAQVVWGKFLASVIFFALLLLLTVQFPLLLKHYGEIDTGKLLTAYAGLFLMGSAFISLGLFASSLTQSQIVAAVGGFSALLLFWMIGWLAESVGGNIGSALEYMSLTNHFTSFAQGTVNTKDLVYFASFIFFFILSINI